MEKPKFLDSKFVQYLQERPFLSGIAFSSLLGGFMWVSTSLYLTGIELANPEPAKTFLEFLSRTAFSQIAISAGLLTFGCAVTVPTVLAISYAFKEYFDKQDNNL